ncbi:MAG: PH domain-containing protein [Candidatus Bathyarchaeia archaeon]
MRIGEKFKPHPNLKRVYRVYLLLVAIPVLTVSVLPTLAVFIFESQIWSMAWPFTFIPLIGALAVFGFVAFWIPKYYDSIWYFLANDEVAVERGVWWKMKHVVPYSRVMSVDIIQGPISRRFGVGSVHVYTAGYTGPAGGSAGPGTRGAEATIWGVLNFTEIRDMIISMVRERPLFGPSETREIGLEILEELRKIRKAVEK